MLYSFIFYSIAATLSNISTAILINFTLNFLYLWHPYSQICVPEEQITKLYNIKMWLFHATFTLNDSDTVSQRALSKQDGL